LKDGGYNPNPSNPNPRKWSSHLYNNEYFDNNGNPKINPNPNTISLNVSVTLTP